ncbi:MAG: hypothetical protein Kow00109_23730 [Acidobacteriota bacterium]
MSERLVGSAGPILVVDIQAAGPRPEVDHLLEIAAAWYDPVSGRVEEFARRCRLPKGGELPPRVTALTGWTAADLAGEPEAEEVWRELGRWLQLLPPARLLVAHYLSYERRFLEYWSDCMAPVLLPEVQVCTWELARRRFPELPAHTLRAVAGYVGFVLEERRRALEHVRATLAVWRALRECSRTGTAAEDRGASPASRHGRGFGAETAWDEMPRAPGIYRFLDASGRVLYVGKATDLRSRLRSYFPPGGRRARGNRIREMVAQVKAVETLPAPSRLEAALLEFEEIQAHEPPYNQVHRPRAGRLVWFGDRELAHWRTLPGEDFPVGPVAVPSALQLAAELWNWIRGARGAPAELANWRREVDGEGAGADLLSALREWAAACFRPWLAVSSPTVALGILRSALLEALSAEEDDGGLDAGEERGGGEEVEGVVASTPGEAGGERRESERELATLQRALLHALARGAEETWRSRWYRRLADATVCWETAGGSRRFLALRGGRIVLQGEVSEEPVEMGCGRIPARGCGRDGEEAAGASAWSETTWRRLGVLTAELRRLVREGGAVEVWFQDGTAWDRRRLSHLLGD